MSEADLLVFLSDSENGVRINDNYYEDSNDLRRVIKFRDIESSGYINESETVININMFNGEQYEVEML